MNFFKQHLSPSAFQKESNKILETFTSMQTKLREMSESIKFETQRKNEEIQKLQKDVSDLEAIDLRNLKVIENIDKILS